MTRSFPKRIVLRMRATLLILSGLAGCAALDRPSLLDQRAAALQQQAANREVRANAALQAQGDASTRYQALDEDRTRQAARFAAGVAAQQQAVARLQPVMRGCLLSNARRLATSSAETADAVATLALRACRPSIMAVARTVELANLPSEGLAADISARLRPELRWTVERERAQGLTTAHGTGDTASIGR